MLNENTWNNIIVLLFEICFYTLLLLWRLSSCSLISARRGKIPIGYLCSISMNVFQFSMLVMIGWSLSRGSTTCRCPPTPNRPTTSSPSSSMPAHTPEKCDKSPSQAPTSSLTTRWIKEISCYWTKLLGKFTKPLNCKVSCNSILTEIVE